MSWPGFVGPGPNRSGDPGPGVGWHYYGLPNGPTTAYTDSRVGRWQWGWSGHPPADGLNWPKMLARYGPPVPTYTPLPPIVSENFACRRGALEPPQVGYGTSVFGYRSAFLRIYSPEVRSKPSPAPPSAGCCRVDVVVPHPDAELWINRAKTAATGSERAFETPELPDGKEARYDLVARWKVSGEEVSESRSVVVAAGKSVVVDFTK